MKLLGAVYAAEATVSAEEVLLGLGAGWADPFDAAVELAAEVGSAVDYSEVIDDVAVPFTHEVGVSSFNKGKG